MDTSRGDGASHVITEISTAAELDRPALFVIHGDLAAIIADFYLLPTDSYGSVRRVWQKQWDLDAQIPMSDPITIFETPRGITLVPCNVGGSESENSVDGVMSRFEQALSELSAWVATADQASMDLAPESSRGRARPILAMPVIGTGGGGLRQRQGEVIRRLVSTIEAFLANLDGIHGSFDVVLVCHSAADYAAAQHVRRGKSVARDYPVWLSTLVDHAQRGRLAALFGAGVSASAGIPTWSELLGLLAARFDVPEATAEGLKDLDPVDAATLVSERANAIHGVDGPLRFQEAIVDFVGLDRATLTHALLANMRLSMAITTNYDRGYELALEGMQLGEPAVLPWDRGASAQGPLVLKLHGDVERGLMVLSRDDFVAMHAFRRPLAGVLQDHMLSGHVLIVGSSMSDPTLVHAAEEVAGLLRQVSVNAVSDPVGDAPMTLSPGGTILLGNSRPARQEILSRSLTVVTATESRVHSSVAARRIDVVLDLINCLASQDLSFALDHRYADLLSPDEVELADQLRRINDELGPGDPTSPLHQSLRAFLREHGAN